MDGVMAAALKNTLHVLAQRALAAPSLRLRRILSP
jgi:hypothetical protein